ncbi:MAG TPA: methylthioribulose 1-phosphate dehydratase [Candidatus Angelobacter sp.]
MAGEFSEIEKLLADLGRGFYARGWVLGTSGNFSTVLSRDPLLITITSSGVDKGNLTPDQFVRLDAQGGVIAGSGRPSAETALHLMLVRARGVGAVLHTHSVWSTIISEAHAVHHGLWIEGYEMLKGLEGVRTHAHREWLPIVDNDQDMAKLAGTVEALLQEHPQAHGFLLRGHGLYTWGEDLSQAKRHIEILEFLLEVIGRSHSETRASSL